MICEKCRELLQITSELIQLAGVNEEIEISYCPECKLIWEITITGYDLNC